MHIWFLSAIKKKRKEKTHLSNTMPPKKKVEVEDVEPAILFPPRLSAADIQSTIEDTSLGEYYSRVVVNEVVSEMEHEIVRAHMDHTAVPWTIQSVITDLMEALQLNFVEREPEPAGEHIQESEVELRIEEPQTIDPDSWARASILQRTHLVKPDSEQFKPPKPERRIVSGGSNPSNITSPLSASSRPGASENVFSLNNSSLAGPSHSNLAGTLRGHSQSVVQGRKRSASEARTNPSTRPSDAGLAADEAMRSEEEVRLLERQKKESERMAHLRSVHERLNKQFAEIRPNQNVSIMIDGATNTIVQVNKPDPKRLPSAQEPRVVIPSDEPPQEPEQSSRRGRAGSPMSYPLRPNEKKEKKPKKDQALFWTPEGQSEPMVRGVAPSPGVASKEGDITKRVDLKPQKSRITKSEYSKMVALQQQQQRMATDTTFLEEPASPKDGPSTSKRGSIKTKALTATPGAPPATGTAQSGGVASPRRDSHPASPSKATPASAPMNRSTSGAADRSGNASIVAKLQERAKQTKGLPHVPERDFPSRAVTPSKASRVNPLTHVPRSSSATPTSLTEVPLSQITAKARASTPSDGMRSRGHSAARGVVHATDRSEVEDEVARDFFESLQTDLSGELSGVNSMS